MFDELGHDTRLFVNDVVAAVRNDVGGDRRPSESVQILGKTAKERPKPLIAADQGERNLGALLMR
jgi:hypothetical protein